MTLCTMCKAWLRLRHSFTFLISLSSFTIGLSLWRALTDFWFSCFTLCSIVIDNGRTKSIIYCSFSFCHIIIYSYTIYRDAGVNFQPHQFKSHLHQSRRALLHRNLARPRFFQLNIRLNRISGQVSSNFSASSNARAFKQLFTLRRPWYFDLAKLFTLVDSPA